MKKIQDVQDNVKKYISDISEAKAKSAESTKELYLKIKVIEDSFKNEVNLLENQLNKLKEKHYETTLNLAIESQKCPRSRSGGHLTPESVEITEDGISLSWYESSFHGDHYNYFEASWSEIVEYEEKSNLV